jgi:hypothetical protein
MFRVLTIAELSLSGSLLLDSLGGEVNRRNVTETDGFLPLSKACSSIIKILYPTEWNIDDTLNYRVNDEKK